MGKVIAVANQKGGVGKTTSTVNLGASLATLGKKVLLIDIDPQGNATSGVGINKGDLEHCVYNVLVEDFSVDQVCTTTDTPNLDVVPATIQLAGAEIELVSASTREGKLKSALTDIRETYDYVLIDCPPSLGLLTINALTASDSVLIPVQCEYYALEVLGQLLNTIKIVRQHLNRELDIEGVLLTMYDTRTRLSNQVAEEVKRYFDEKVFNTIIARNIRLAEAPSFGKPAILYDASSAGAKNYLSLASEIMHLNKKLFKSRPVLS